MKLDHNSKREVMERVTLKVTASQNEYLNDLANEFGTNKSVIIRMIIKSYMKHHGMRGR